MGAVSCEVPNFGTVVALMPFAQDVYVHGTSLATIGDASAGVAVSRGLPDAYRGSSSRWGSGLTGSSGGEARFEGELLLALFPEASKLEDTRLEVGVGLRYIASTIDRVDEGRGRRLS